MAGLKGLVDTSASCGAANPLMKLTNHFSQDQAKSDLALAVEKRDNLVDEFNQFQRPKGQPQSFHMKDLLNALEPQNTAAPDIKAPLDVLWTKEFSQRQQQPTNSLQLQTSTSLNSTSTLQNGSGTLSNYQTASNWAEDYLKEVPELKTNGAANQLYETLNEDPRFSESEFKSFVKDLGNTGEKWTEEFLSSKDGDFVSSDAGGATITSKKATDADWVEEFVDITDEDVEANFNRQQDFWTKMENEWKEMAEKNKETGEHPWLDDFEEVHGFAQYEKYTFQVEGNQLSSGGENSLEDGKKKLEEGDLPSAVLLFEAAAQHSPENAEAWYLLGTSQAKNEQDPSAIAALLQSLRLDPGNCEAIIALAASLTNESMQSHACYALQDWISSKNDREAGAGATSKLEILSTKITSSFMSRDLHQQTLDLFLNLARQGGGDIDADVQCGLGILLNLSGDYAKAGDCFEAALRVRPDDALSWNRLGATLANGDRSEEAIGAYRKALDLYPGFVRARYNLGISCINLKAYDVAVEHFLSALNFQAGPESSKQNKSEDLKRKVMSDNVWSSLRLSLGLMGKRELYPLIEERNLEKLNEILKK